MNESVKIDYYTIGKSKGGNQDWFTDFWMHIGGCAALAACDLSICAARNYQLYSCCPFPVHSIRKEDYIRFGMMMKPYISPRIGGVIRLSTFTNGFGKYLSDRGYRVEFKECSGKESYENAKKFVVEAIKKNLPIAYLMLKHKNEQLKDLNWHWFMITGYCVRNEKMEVYYHTYGQEYHVDFYKLWNTNRILKGGMVTIRSIHPQ